MQAHVEHIPPQNGRICWVWWVSICSCCLTLPPIILCLIVPRIALSDLAIRSLKSASQTDYWDKGLANFGIRVGPKRKTFLILLGPKRKRVIIGHYPEWSLQKARRKAMLMLASHGGQEVDVDFEDALELFLSFQAQNNKPSTVRETTRLLRGHFPLTGPLSTITARRINAVLDQLRRSEANHAFVAIRALLNWCVGKQYLDRSPLQNAKLPHKTRSRSRTLSPVELMHVWFEAASDDKPSYKAIRLLILTGQRTQEIAGLEWSMINEIERTITLPPILTKNNSQHTFPFGDAVAAILATIPKTSSRLFPKRTEDTTYSWGTIKRHFDREMPLPHWTLHDLRRTFATLNAELGTAPHVTEALLNHKTGVRSPIQRIYDRYTYLPEMREAIRRYDAHLGMLYAAVLSTAAQSGAMEEPALMAAE